MRVLILLAFCGSTLAGLQRQQRIMGGEPTTVEHYPYMTNVQLNHDIFWAQVCGGSLVTRRTVLSAAHCYINNPLVIRWRVRVGTSFASSQGQVHAVSGFILHPDYSIQTYDSDVAIIRLATAAVLSDSVRPVHIASPGYIPPDGTPVTAVGWGALRYEAPTPEQLQHVELYVINQEICAKKYRYLQIHSPGVPNVTAGMICSGVPDVGGRDFCKGDLGGPLVYTQDPNFGHVIVGINSWGYLCADTFFPGVSARVSYYSEWIVKHGSY